MEGSISGGFFLSPVSPMNTRIFFGTDLINENDNLFLDNHLKVNLSCSNFDITINETCDIFPIILVLIMHLLPSTRNFKRWWIPLIKFGKDIEDQNIASNSLKICCV